MNNRKTLITLVFKLNVLFKIIPIHNEIYYMHTNVQRNLYCFGDNCTIGKVTKKYM